MAAIEKTTEDGSEAQLITIPTDISRSDSAAIRATDNGYDQMFAGVGNSEASPAQSPSVMTHLGSATSILAGPTKLNLTVKMPVKDSDDQMDFRIGTEDLAAPLNDIHNPANILNAYQRAQLSSKTVSVAADPQTLGPDTAASFIGKTGVLTAETQKIPGQAVDTSASVSQEARIVGVEKSGTGVAFRCEVSEPLVDLNLSTSAGGIEPTFGSKLSSIFQTQDKQTDGPSAGFKNAAAKLGRF